MGRIIQQERKKPTNPYLPLIGLFLAISIGILAFGISGFLNEIILEQFPEVQAKLATEENGKYYLQGAVGVSIWFCGFVTVMSIVSMSMTSDIVDEEYSIMLPVNPTKKELAKYRKAMSKNRKDKIRAAKRLKKKKDKEASHRR